MKLILKGGGLKRNQKSRKGDRFSRFLTGDLGATFLATLDFLLKKGLKKMKKLTSFVSNDFRSSNDFRN